MQIRNRGRSLLGAKTRAAATAVTDIHAHISSTLGMSLDQLLLEKRRQSQSMIPFLEQVRSLPCVGPEDAEKLERLIAKTKGN